MKEESIRYYSPIIGRDFDMLIFGDGGIPVIAFPTSIWEGIIRTAISNSLKV
ncbi:MAG: hypothetical protein R2847_10380 [Bacteroidia bacterium]